MPKISITSLEDPRLEAYRQLKDTNNTRREGLFVAEGVKLARRLVESDYEVVSILTDERYLAHFADVSPEVPIFVVPEAWVEQIIGFNFHRGVLACGRKKPALRIEDVAAMIQADQPTTLAICPDVQDPENLGSILRIASAFGVTAIVLGKQTADPFSRRVLRVSMGAAFRVPVISVVDMPAALEKLRNNFQFERWATVIEEDATPLGQTIRPTRLALLFGSEGHGLERQLIELCEQRVKIPMAPNVDSLNVAVAAGIFFYQVLGSSPEAVKVPPG